MKRTLLFPALLAAFGAALFVLTATSAQAQRANTRGFFLNGHLNAASITYDDKNIDINTQTGGGAGLQVGYGVSRIVTIYLGLNGSVVDSDDLNDAYTLSHVDLGVQLNFPSRRSQAVPYANLALTARQATFDVAGPGEIDLSGGGLTLGGGLKYYLSRAVALDGGILLTFGSFTSVDFGGVAVNIDDINATSGRFMIGVSFYPSRR